LFLESSSVGGTAVCFARPRAPKQSRLPRPAAEIIIGNPAIADVAIQSVNLLVVTGKSFGITNIIALDAERNVIQDQRVLVRRDEAKVVNLQRGTERQSFNCTPQCNPSIVIGDDQKYFDMISKAAQAKIGFSERAADSGAPAASQCASACAATANDRCGASPAQRLSSIYKAQRASAGFMGFSRLPPDSAAKHGMVLFELAQGEGSNDGANCGQEPGQRAIELM
jgi:Pilus formation protein N terminal region